MSKNVVLGVSASVAIYKSCALARLLQSRGMAVRTVLSPAAARFISPLLFESLTHNPAEVDLFDSKQGHLRHIALAEWADVLVIAPCTANTLAKLALGLGDNLLTALALALPPQKPIIIAPAMNVFMWKNETIQNHCRFLKESGRCRFVGPAQGVLASGQKGEGVMADIKEIASAVEKEG